MNLMDDGDEDIKGSSNYFIKTLKKVKRWKKVTNPNWYKGKLSSNFKTKEILLMWLMQSVINKEKEEFFRKEEMDYNYLNLNKQIVEPENKMKTVEIFASRVNLILERKEEHLVFWRPCVWANT